MPIVRLSVPSEMQRSIVRQLGGGIHQAMVEILAVPENDVFQQVQRFQAEDRTIDPTFPNVSRAGQTVIVEIALVGGRTRAQKVAFYERVAAVFREAGVRDDECFIALSDSPIENWSPGKGIAFAG